MVQIHILTNQKIMWKWNKRLNDQSLNEKWRNQVKKSEHNEKTNFAKRNKIFGIRWIEALGYQ